MITKICSFTFSGVDIIDVDVQVQITSGVPNFIIVGLADKTIGESKERVRAALSSIGLALPAKRIVVNLAPADLVKEGSHFDLAIALVILSAMRVLPSEDIMDYLVFGELSLDGSILPVNGALPAAIGASARDKGIICSKHNGSEAAWSGNEKIIAADNLLSLISHFSGSQVIAKPEPMASPKLHNYPDLKDVKGQKIAKRALEIAAAGGHNMLMYGPPGTGKSMLASRLPSILPKLTSSEILEISMVASIAGKITQGCLTNERPFRAPHHSCSIAAMVGGGVGRKVKPGEISLAHNGVLFLDELPEFASGVIESLRQPIEKGEILVSRSGMQVKYPANFQLIAAMNPCKCGYLGDVSKECNKAPACKSTYQGKISGPILDRFDLHVEVANEEDYNFDSAKTNDSESSDIVANRVIAARKIQIERYEGYDISVNNNLDGQLLIEYALPLDDGRDVLNAAAEKFKFSMRSYNRVLRVARTIADLEGAVHVKKIHIAESISYRNLTFLNARMG
jgi:magnesium chelatase family protein